MNPIDLTHYVSQLVTGLAVFALASLILHARLYLLESTRRDWR